jgi:hypothetical protein
MKLFIKIVAACFAATVLVGCSSKGEQAAVKEEADQIEEAHLDGREAARAFINREFKDSMELQLEMVKAGASRAKYDSLPKCRAAYDSAFISTVRTVKPEVARELSRRSGR